MRSATVLTLLLLSGCTFVDVRETTWDATQDPRAKDVAGRCFELLRDAVVYSAGEQTRWLAVPNDRQTSSSDGDGRIVPKGSRLVIASVSATHYPQVGTTLKPYARIDGELVAAGQLFYFQAGSDPLRPREDDIARCD
ncbi:MAG TPA: hypothetical protein VFB32_03780 [Rudaea sp.]|nr:hypothetical protein [Rudaea sp.]